tara:strand:+ start:752 stop:1099 length:348 start_codon:yes stop_codon:yes gene_type:complete
MVAIDQSLLKRASIINNLLIRLLNWDKIKSKKIINIHNINLIYIKQAYVYLENIANLIKKNKINNYHFVDKIIEERIRYDIQILEQLVNKEIVSRHYEMKKIYLEETKITKMTKI